MPSDTGSISALARDLNNQLISSKWSMPGFFTTAWPKQILTVDRDDLSRARLLRDTGASVTRAGTFMACWLHDSGWFMTRKTCQTNGQIHTHTRLTPCWWLLTKACSSPPSCVCSWPRPQASSPQKHAVSDCLTWSWAAENKQRRAPGSPAGRLIELRVCLQVCRRAVA